MELRRLYTMGDLKDFEYLWTTEKEKHYLKILDNKFCIMDTSNMMLLVEENELYIQIVKAMLNNGIRVVKCNKNTGELIPVSFLAALQSYEEFENNNSDVKVKIIWKKDISIQKQICSLKKLSVSFAQMPIADLYKMAKNNDIEWEFTEMRYDEAKKWVDHARSYGLDVEIVR